MRILSLKFLKRIWPWLFTETFSKAHLSVSFLFFTLETGFNFTENIRIQRLSIFLLSLHFEESVADAILLIGAQELWRVSWSLCVASLMSMFFHPLRCLRPEFNVKILFFISNFLLLLPYVADLAATDDQHGRNVSHISVVEGYIFGEIQQLIKNPPFLTGCETPSYAG